MKKEIFILGLVLSLAAVAPAGARGQSGRNDRRSGDDGRRSQERVCLYENNNYQGSEECYQPGDDVSQMHGREKKVSSIRFFGNATLTIFDKKDFRGNSVQLSSDVRDLAQYRTGGPLTGNWNDRIGSFRVSSPNYRGNDRYSNNGRRDEPRDVVCVYEDVNYRGNYDCFTTGDSRSDLNRSGGWNDRISSIRVFGNGRATVFRDINYRGDRLLIDRDIPNLRDMRLPGSQNWDNQISSIELSNGRFNPTSNRR